MPPPETLGSARAIVAAILCAEWFRKHGLPNSASNKDIFIEEYRDMLRRLESAALP